MRKHAGNFEVIARAIIVHEDKILLCNTKGHDWWYLPGGHVEFGEQASIALAREIKEELALEATQISNVGTVEHMYDFEGEQHHEINLVFAVELSTYEFVPQEEHIQFKWVDIASLTSENVQPEVLRHAVVDWFKNPVLFWGSTKGA